MMCYESDKLYTQNNLSLIKYIYMLLNLLIFCLTNFFGKRHEKNQNEQL